MQSAGAASSPSPPCQVRSRFRLLGPFCRSPAKLWVSYISLIGCRARLWLAAKRAILNRGGYRESVRPIFAKVARVPPCSPGCPARQTSVDSGVGDLYDAHGQGGINGADPRTAFARAAGPVTPIGRIPRAKTFSNRRLPLRRPSRPPSYTRRFRRVSPRCGHPFL